MTTAASPGPISSETMTNYGSQQNSDSFVEPRMSQWPLQDLQVQAEERHKRSHEKQEKKLKQNFFSPQLSLVCQKPTGNYKLQKKPHALCTLQHKFYCRFDRKRLNQHSTQPIFTATPFHTLIGPTPSLSNAYLPPQAPPNKDHHSTSIPPLTIEHKL